MPLSARLETGDCGLLGAPCRARRLPCVPGTLAAAPRVRLRLLPQPQRLGLCGSRTPLTPLPRRPAGLRPPCRRSQSPAGPGGGAQGEYRPSAPPPPPGEAAEASQCRLERPRRGSRAGFLGTAPPRPARDGPAHWPGGAARAHLGRSRGQPRSPARRAPDSRSRRRRLAAAILNSAQGLAVLSYPHA